MIIKRQESKEHGRAVKEAPLCCVYTFPFPSSGSVTNWQSVRENTHTFFHAPLPPNSSQLKKNKESKNRISSNCDAYHLNYPRVASEFETWLDNVNEYYLCHDSFQTFLTDENTPRTIIKIKIKACLGGDVYLGYDFMEDYSLKIIGKRGDKYVVTEAFPFS